MYDFRKSPLLARRVPGVRRSFLISLMLFLFIYSLSSVLQTILLTAVQSVILFPAISALIQAKGPLPPDQYQQALEELIIQQTGNIETPLILISLLSTMASIAVVVFACLLIDRRKVSTCGIVSEHALLYTLGGILAGFAMMGIVTLICTWRGGITLTRDSGVNAGVIFLFFIAFLVQGAAEEFLIHGYLMTSFLHGYNVWISLIVSSVAFALLHAGNVGVGILPFVNLFLFAMFAGMLTLRSGSILPASAMHGMWNFTEGNLFGFSVSGMDRMPSVWLAESDGTHILTSGGLFGPEGGLAVTFVLIIAIVAIWYFPSLKKVSTNA